MTVTKTNDFEGPSDLPLMDIQNCDDVCPSLAKMTPTSISLVGVCAEMADQANPHLEPSCDIQKCNRLRVR